MNKFICAEGGNAGSIVLYVVLIVALVAMLIMPYFSQKKKNQEYMKMLESMRVGDLVKTAGGIIGKITKITDKGDIKTVILETGSKSEKSYMEFDMSMIYCVLKSTKAAAEETKAEETKVEEVKTTEEAEKPEQVKTEETKAEEVKVEEKPKTEAKKTTTKKATAKTTAKSTAKKTTKK